MTNKLRAKMLKIEIEALKEEISKQRLYSEEWCSRVDTLLQQVIGDAEVLAEEVENAAA